MAYRVGLDWHCSHTVNGNRCEAVFLNLWVATKILVAMLPWVGRETV